MPRSEKWTLVIKVRSIENGYHRDLSARLHSWDTHCFSGVYETCEQQQEQEKQCPLRTLDDP
jgi:hypothetical protein